MTVARIENPDDRTVLELQRARRRDDYRRQRDAERQRQAVEREAAHREKIERAEAAQADGAASRVVSGSRPPSARSAPERPSASVKNSSVAGRSAVRPCSRRSSAGSVGSRPREDLLLDAASGHVPDVRAGDSGAGWPRPSHSPRPRTRRSARLASRRSTTCSPITRRSRGAGCRPRPRRSGPSWPRPSACGPTISGTSSRSTTRRRSSRRAPRSACLRGLFDSATGRHSGTPATAAVCSRSSARSSARCRRFRKSSSSCATSGPISS